VAGFSWKVNLVKCLISLCVQNLCILNFDWGGRPTSPWLCPWHQRAEMTWKVCVHVCMCACVCVRVLQSLLETLLSSSMCCRSCIVDMCECPLRHCYCESFTAYAHECMRLGVQLPDWRSSTGCPSAWTEHKAHAVPRNRPPPPRLH
jgi:hypothetical protein